MTDHSSAPPASAGREEERDPESLETFLREMAADHARGLRLHRDNRSDARRLTLAADALSTPYFYESWLRESRKVDALREAVEGVVLLLDGVLEIAGRDERMWVGTSLLRELRAALSPQPKEGA